MVIKITMKKRNNRMRMKGRIVQIPITIVAVLIVLIKTPGVNIVEQVIE